MKKIKLSDTFPTSSSPKETLSASPRFKIKKSGGEADGKDEVHPVVTEKTPEQRGGGRLVSYATAKRCQKRKKREDTNTSTAYPEWNHPRSAGRRKKYQRKNPDFPGLIFYPCGEDHAWKATVSPVDPKALHPATSGAERETCKQSKG